jgi:hypothetical protein
MHGAIIVVCVFSNSFQTASKYGKQKRRRKKTVAKGLSSNQTNEIK